MNSSTEIASTSFDDPEFLQDLRRQMLRFASLQLSDAHLAEDAVQEALIGAFKSVNRFGGRAALKTWVFAILKNKIADVLRQRQRLREADMVLHTREEDEDFRELFDARGFWQADERPAAWGDPDQAVHSAQFWRVFEACLDHLPNQQAWVFMMREFLELETPEICEAAGITVTNLNVMLHRARLRLRECLENNWFAPGEAPC
jgi:RNA polymerase sigma-70 factor (ECF subfamily)